MPEVPVAPHLSSIWCCRCSRFWQSNRWVMVSHCCFNLHFPDDIRGGDSFLTLVCHLCILYFCVCENKLYSISKVQLYNTVLSTIVTMFYIISLDFIHLIIKVCTLSSNSPHSPTSQSPGNHQYTLCFHEFNFV